MPGRHCARPSPSKPATTPVRNPSDKILCCLLPEHASTPSRNLAGVRKISKHRAGYLIPSSCTACGAGQAPLDKLNVQVARTRLAWGFADLPLM